MTPAELRDYALAFGMMASAGAVLTFLWKMLTALVGIQTAIGMKGPVRTGLLGDVEEIKDGLERVEAKQHEIELKTAVIETNVAQRRAGDKRG